jgi:hypothetical protein
MRTHILFWIKTIGSTQVDQPGGAVSSGIAGAFGRGLRDAGSWRFALTGEPVDKRLRRIYKDKNEESGGERQTDHHQNVGKSERQRASSASRAGPFAG